MAGHEQRKKQKETRTPNLGKQARRKERPHGRPVRGWDDNIQIDLNGRGWEVVDWTNLYRDKVQ